MSIIKLDQKRSYNDEKYVYFSEFGRDYYYYQINDSDELCCFVNSLYDIKTAKEIGEKISVKPSSIEDNPSTIDGEFRVTTMLINIYCGSNEFKYFTSDRYIYLPPFIERVYFSERCVKSTSRHYFPRLAITGDNRNICQVCADTFEDMDRQLFFSGDKKELFQYWEYDNNKTSQNIILPDGLETIHKFAFMSAKKIKTLHIPASVKEIGKGAFLNAEIEEIVFDGKWTTDIDADAFSGLKVTDHTVDPHMCIDICVHTHIWIRDTAQNMCSLTDFRKAIQSIECKTLSLVAPDLCNENSPEIGCIRVTQSYYQDVYSKTWNEAIHNEGIVDIKISDIKDIEEYDIPTFKPVKGSKIVLHDTDSDHLHLCHIVYEPIEMIRQKICTARK